MDWFERLTGFRETGYAETRSLHSVQGDRLHSAANGRSYGIGTLELASLAELRERAATISPGSRRFSVQIVQGDVGEMHRASHHAGAVFQVASQFNMLEMISPDVTPEHGVTRYQRDPTQGPACAIAAGAATIYRNYFANVNGQAGQTTQAQLDGLQDLGQALSELLGTPVESLWEMRNGYALCSRHGLDLISGLLQRLPASEVDALRGMLRIGLHRKIDVTDGQGQVLHAVTQAFCSALPIAYSRVDARHWAPFARLVLEAAYEATVCAAIVNAHENGSPILLLTRLGGGAFGNDDAWIDDAIRKGLVQATAAGLDIRFVSRELPSPGMLQLVADATS